MATVSKWVKQNSLSVYFFIAFAFSWSIYIPLVAVQHGWIKTQISFSIHYFSSFGPAFAAFIVTTLTTGKDGLQELWGRITKWRVGRGYAIFALLSPVVLFFLAAIAMRTIKGEWPDLRLLGQANYLPYLGWGVLPVWLITFGFGEEIGWRGFALPRLQSQMSISKATFILALLWALWHSPAFFYLDTIEDLGGIIINPGFLVDVLFGAVLFTWLYNGTGGSILMVAIWHALFDLFTASAAGRDFIPIITSAGVIAWALYVANTKKPWGFHFQQKHTL